MAAVQRKLVHKQFNSPMGLYSQQNVKETLNRELKAFGTDGIEIDEQISKNLASSAVMRAVEEEEQMKCGYKRVAWPPVSEERIVREFTPQPQPQPPQQGPYNQAPQHQQQQHQQYQQQSSVAAAPATAASPQGPIYNNVHPAAARQNSPYPYQQQQQQQYQPPQNYQQSQQQYHHQPPPQQQQQPTQYTQAQFSRQASREPTITTPYQQSTQPQQQQPQYQHQQQQHQQQYEQPTSPTAGWKHIQPPTPKQQLQYHSPSAVGSNVEPHYPAYAPTTQAQQQQQYRAPSFDRYQQPKQQPLQQPQYNQQQPQYNQQHQQPQQQQPSWAHNQQPLQQQQSQQPLYQAPQYQQQPQSQQQYQAPSNYPEPQQQYHQPQYQTEPQYNSYSQPQQQQHQSLSHDQTDRQQSVPQDYRGASPGIITLRRETPVSQKPAPVFSSQPAAVSYQGGCNMRGDLKWPPPEYKVAAEKENEERRKLALGPVCRPRKVDRQDYTSFFAKNALNSYYPSYKVPPGTQHMY